MKIDDATPEQLERWAEELTAQFEALRSKGLRLDLTRGKPSSAQLDLAQGLDGILDGDYATAAGVDTRNYGGLDGIPEARALGAELLGVPVDNVLAGGNSSLTLMHQAVSIAYFFGLSGPGSAWRHASTVRFLCPVPGYDRHFAICEHLGIEMLTVPMTETGPDMDAVEAKIASDPSIRGMWCVPKYSNPTGVVYAPDTVRRIARLGKVADPSFRVFWDNAYAVHDLSEHPPELASVFDAGVAEGTEDTVLQFASTSKITLAGAGAAFLGASAGNLRGFEKALGFMTIGPDKVNQLRHARFFAADGSLSAHMRKHAEILRPRFARVLDALEAAFEGSDLGRWATPEGGYFVAFDTRPGLAREVVRLAGEAGVKLTPAGATFPYGRDPDDTNIRIAPTVPSVEEVGAAMEVFVTCVKLASVRQALG